MSNTIDAAAEVERTILGACLLESEADTDLACSVLRPENFSLDSHRILFQEIQRLHLAQMPVNIVTLMQELSRLKSLESVGGPSYISDLTNGIPRNLGENLRHYAERIKEFWRQRELRKLGEWIELVSIDGEESASSIIQRTSASLESIAGESAEGSVDVAATILLTIERFNQQRKMDHSPGISFGIQELDRQTGGMMPGFQTAVGASSGVGKTTFMCQAILAALESGNPVDAFLLEPTRDQVTLRLASLMSGVRYEAVTKPWISTADEAQRITEASYRLGEMPLRLHARAAMTLDEVLGLARVGINRYGTRLICLDYIQRLRIRTAEREEPLRQRVARASTALADLVKNTNAHCLLLSQITTGRKSGAQAVPTMFDFRESSQIENDARTIVLLHRIYDETEGHYTNDGAIFVPKQTFGSPCNIKAWFDPKMASWRDTIPAASYQESWHERSER